LKKGGNLIFPLEIVSGHFLGTALLDHHTFFQNIFDTVIVVFDLLFHFFPFVMHCDFLLDFFGFSFALLKRRLPFFKQVFETLLFDNFCNLLLFPNNFLSQIILELNGKNTSSIISLSHLE
jgi:hypothetical protein